MVHRAEKTGGRIVLSHFKGKVDSRFPEMRD
jgi:hypothetical protein